MELSTDSQLILMFGCDTRAAPPVPICREAEEPMSEPTSRLEILSRRAVLTRALALGALVAVPGVAC
jgi:hypothetical protein